MKKKTKKKHFIVSCIIYPFDIIVSLDQTDDELFEVLKVYGYTSKDEFSTAWNMGTSSGRFAMNSKNHSILRLVTNPDKYKMMSCVSHEIFHAVTFILDHVGMKFKLLVSDEAYSYLVGYLTEQIYKELEL